MISLREGQSVKNGRVHVTEKRKERHAVSEGLAPTVILSLLPT